MVFANAWGVQGRPGREEELFTALVGKYGPEPSGNKRGSDGGESGDWKSRITKYYEAKCPEKVATIDTALDKYKGREQDLMDALVKKYGPEGEGGNKGGVKDDWKTRIT
eukprot:gene20304-1063_t